MKKSSWIYLGIRKKGTAAMAVPFSESFIDYDVSTIEGYSR